MSKADGNPGSGPSPTTSTIPRRALQLSPSWEGPFKETGMHRPATIWLRLEEYLTLMPKHLCKFYP
jgi:hypothetical protein